MLVVIYYNLNHMAIVIALFLYGPTIYSHCVQLKSLPRTTETVRLQTAEFPICGGGWLITV